MDPVIGKLSMSMSIPKGLAIDQVKVDDTGKEKFGVAPKDVSTGHALATAPATATTAATTAATATSTATAVNGNASSVPTHVFDSPEGGGLGGLDDALTFLGVDSVKLKELVNPPLDSDQVRGPSTVGLHLEILQSFAESSVDLLLLFLLLLIFLIMLSLSSLPLLAL